MDKAETCKRTRTPAPGSLADSTDTALEGVRNASRIAAGIAVWATADGHDRVARQAQAIVAKLEASLRLVEDAMMYYAGTRRRPTRSGRKVAYKGKR